MLTEYQRWVDSMVKQGVVETEKGTLFSRDVWDSASISTGASITLSDLNPQGRMTLYVKSDLAGNLKLELSPKNSAEGEKWFEEDDSPYAILAGDAALFEIGYVAKSLKFTWTGSNPTDISVHVVGVK